MPRQAPVSREPRDAAAPGDLAPPDPSFQAYQVNRGTAAELMATALKDRDLLRQLMAMPALERIAAAISDARFRRSTLVRLLALETECALGEPGRDPRPAAELGAALAAALPHDPEGQAQRRAAWAYWLLGKALLRALQWRLAEDAFLCIWAFIPRGDRASEGEALACSGLAQLHEDLGNEQQAGAMFLRAAYLYSQRRAWAPEAACQAQLGLLLHRGGDLESAARPLRAALRQIDAAFAPSLAARLRLALAGIETVLGHTGRADRELRLARALYPLAASPAEAIERSWSEARIAAAAGRDDEAEAQLEWVRRELLARGSPAEAAQCSCEQILIQIEGRRFGAALGVTDELALAFPPAGEPWARELANLVHMATEEPAACYPASYELRRRLSLRAAVDPGRPALLVPARVLADRLFCGCGELEDPIGAAAEL